MITKAVPIGRRRLALFVLVLFFLAVLPVGAQTTPGSGFTESFGNSSNLCWSGGPSLCDQMWIAQGSAQSIVATPGAPPPNTVGPNSLQMIEAAGTRSYIYTTGSFPRIPAGTPFDLSFTLDVTSQAMNAYDLITLLTPSNAANGSEYPALISFAYDGTNFQLQASGSSFTSKLNLSLDAWHTIQLHVAPGMNASFLELDGGAPASFTANASDFAYLAVGSTLGQLDAISYYIGNVSVNPALAGDPPPSAYIDFENSTDGTTVTTDILAASTHCGNGIWSLSTTPIIGMTISTDAQKQLPSPVTTCATSYNDAAGTRGLRYDISQSASFATYAWSTTTSSSASAGFFYQITLSDQNFYSVFAITADGADYAILQVHDGSMYLETAAGISTPIPVSPNVWYWVTLQYNAGGTHQMQVYDTASWTLLGSVSGAATANSRPNGIEIGRLGSESGFPSAFWYYDYILLDYLTAVFPLVPEAPQGDFAIVASPASAAVMQGGATSYDVSISPTGGFTGQVTLSVSGLPSGATGSFNPNPAIPSSTLSVTTTTSTPPGTYTLTITGVSGSLTHTTSASLTVSAANAQTPTLVQHVLGPTSESSGKNYYRLPLSMPSLSGNCMVVGVATDSLGSTVTVTDDKGNVYTQRVVVSGNEVVSLFTSATITPGVTMITASFSPAVNDVQVAASEFYNTSCVLDGTATGSGTGTTVATGLLTTTFAGDLIYQFGMQDGATEMTSWGQGASPWNLLHADIQGWIGGSGAQYQVQSTTGSITPSMTMAPSNHFDTVAIALQAALQGTAPSGIRVVHTYHTHISGSLPSPITMQFPSTGNAIVVIPNLVQALNFTGMSDGNNNTYSFAGPNFTNSGSGTLRIAYACSAATSTTLSGMQLTFSGTNVSGDVVIVYDIAGAATACFDSTAGNPTASGTQTSLGTLTGVVITPSSANGLVFATLGQTSNTSTAATPGLFGAAVDSPESTSGEMDENNGWLVYKNPDTSQITTTWTISNNGQPGGAQEWASMAAAFKAAPP